MIINDKTQHYRKIRVYLDENDIIGIITKHVQNETGISIDRNTKTDIRIGHKDRAGTAGKEGFIEMVIKNDLEKNK